MPLLKLRRVLAAKQEVTPGTAIALSSGTDGMINAYDVSIDADIPFNERMAAGAFGRLPGVVGAEAGSLKFKIEAYGSGTSGTSPAWALVLLPACGMVETSGAWSHVSAYSSQKTVTIAVLEDGIEKKLVGAMGTWSFNGDDGKVPYFDFDFKGVWTAPTDVALFTPQFSTVVPPRFAGATLTIGSYTPTCSKLSVKQGCKVEMREDVTQASGYIAAIITDRKVTGSLDPEATTVATYNPFGLWLAGTTAALTCTIGSSGTGLTIAAPALQYESIKEGERNGKVVHDLNWVAAQSGSTTEDDLSITF
jgi:hypothetical protein